MKRYHVILDAHKVDNKYLDDEKFIDNLLREICELIDMNILHGPTVIRGIEANPGLSAFCIIDFSHISIHTFTKTNNICVDIFSCKPFDYNKVRDHLAEKMEIGEGNFVFHEVKYTEIA